MQYSKTLLVASLGACLFGPLPNALASVNTEVGSTAPAFHAQTLEGNRVDLDKFRGEKPVYLKFWATWCSYCVEELPHLQTIKDRYGDEVEIISINVGFNEKKEKVQAYMQSRGFDIPVVFDQQGSITQDYQVVGTPHHVLIDKQGKIAYRTFLATDQLDDIVEAWALEQRQSAATLR